MSLDPPGKATAGIHAGSTPARSASTQEDCGNAMLRFAGILKVGISHEPADIRI
jgi:hypothetical protein